MSDIIYEPISLGAACETKFQIARRLYFTHLGRKSEMGFKLEMLDQQRRDKTFGWASFDWQRTPFQAVLSYLEQDFQGVFECEDLRVEGPMIMHRTLLSEHVHNFDDFRLGWDGAALATAYPGAFRRFERRAQRFRDLMTRPGPYLYIWAASYLENTLVLPSVSEVARLIELLGARSPDHRFHILMVGTEGAEGDVDYSDLGDKVSKAYRKSASAKPDGLRWQGNDAGWDAIFEPFTLVHHTELKA